MRLKDLFEAIGIIGSVHKGVKRTSVAAAILQCAASKQPCPIRHGPGQVTARVCVLQFGIACSNVRSE